MKYILSLDQGTTSSRAIIFDHNGKSIAIAQQEFTQHYPKPAWVEHDANEIWDTQIEVARKALKLAKLKSTDIAGIGITNQRETTVIWDKNTSKPVHNAIVWQDRRTADLTAQLKSDGKENLFQEKTGLLLDPYFSGTKIKWILDNVEGARDKASKGELAFGTIDTWLAWKLSGGRSHVTDATNASRTLLYNIHTQEWDESLLEILDIPKSILPKVSSSSEIFGTCYDKSPLAGIPIAGIAGDQQAALFGQACFHPGMAKNTYGTGCFLLLNTGNKPVQSSNKLLTTIAVKLGGNTEYALEGSVFIGGALIQWLRDELGIIKQATEIEALASSVENSHGVCIVPAFAGLGAPYWDTQARGSIFGLTRGSSKAHIARAALEAIALQSLELLEAMKQDAQIDLKELRVDGGACVNNLLMQIQSNLLQTPVVRPKTTETTALGAAYLAGLAVGYWKNREEIAELWQADQTFQPKHDPENTKKLIATWKKGVQRAVQWEE